MQELLEQLSSISRSVCIMWQALESAQNLSQVKIQMHHFNAAHLKSNRTVFLLLQKQWHRWSKYDRCCENPPYVPSLKIICAAAVDPLSLCDVTWSQLGLKHEQLSMRAGSTSGSSHFHISPWYHEEWIRASRTAMARPGRCTNNMYMFCWKAAAML